MFKKEKFKIDYNPLKKRWEEQKKTLSEEQIQMIEKWPEKGENLKVLKRTRREKHDGDIFLCSLNGTVYYYGKILKANVVNKTDSFMNGGILACIFRDKTTEKNLSKYKGDYANLLMVPFVVTSQYWSMGWFETIGNIPLTKEDKDLDYGFYNRDFIGLQGGFYKETGESLNHIPKYYKYLGITTLIGVYKELRKQSIIDPSLLVED